MAAFAGELGAVPLEEVAGWSADAGGGGERAEAVFAAGFLVCEGPAEGDEGEEDEREDLDEVCGEGVGRGERGGEVGAEEEGEEKEKVEFGGEEELAFEPDDDAGGCGLVGVTAGSDGEGHKDDECGGEGDAWGEICEAEGEGVRAGVESEADASGEEAEAEEGGEAEDGCAAEDAVGGFGA